ETYRASEYWAAPDEFMAYSGDCEDYAIAKFFALRELGFANQELRIAVVYDNLRRIGHAVLAVYTEGDILILNNQTDTIASHARYDNFVPWYLVNETTLWTAAGPVLSALIPEFSVAGPAAGARASAKAILSAQTRRPGVRWDAPRPPRATDRKGPA
ncbi:MAG: transglutaminase-like cysteine peptidase, partial [Proteobacteria bacterium]|nr:transglutaminase-like cysteine peptidase [Pseudomonadota bacterium]